MAVSKATLQGYVDWCTSPEPAPIFQRRVAALLAVWPKANPEDGIPFYYGALKYLPASYLLPARFYGVLFSQDVNEYWTLNIKLFDLIEISLLPPSGILSETAQVNRWMATDLAPSEMILNFEDDYANYALDLADETVIDWSLIRRRNMALLVERAGVGRKSRPDEKPASASA